MRRTVVVLGLTLSVLMVVSASAGMQIGAKIWQMDTSFQFAGDAEQESDGLALGPTISFDLGDDFWVSAMWLVGEEEWNDGSEANTQDAEAVLALALDWIDLGVGFRYSEDEDAASGAKFRKYGPMAYVGAGNSFGEDSPLGWYAGASWMFVDLNDDWDWGEHYNVEAGLSLYLDPLSATVGYRLKEHYDADNDLKYEGVTASLAIAL
ncbi:MAG: hypothetical protein ISS31_07105 [Kiritimatiellae bacterium]|nr:hypothetical protein [Kiritimatiellia bacterium]